MNRERKRGSKTVSEEEEREEERGGIGKQGQVENDHDRLRERGRWRKMVK